MVPTKEEMIAFLNSDEIVRVEENGAVVPLGLEKIEDSGASYYVRLHGIAWGQPLLLNYPDHQG